MSARAIRREDWTAPLMCAFTRKRGRERILMLVNVLVVFEERRR